MRQLHAFWRPRGTGGIDQREEIVGLDGLTRAGNLFSAVLAREQLVESARAGLVVIRHHDVANLRRALARGDHTLDEGRLGHDDFGARVRQLVSDLVGRERLI